MPTIVDFLLCRSKKRAIFVLLITLEPLKTKTMKTLTSDRFIKTAVIVLIAFWAVVAGYTVAVML